MVPEYFTRLPDQMIEEIAQHPPMEIMEEDGDRIYWHEVQFQYDGLICQSAVLNGTHVPFTQRDVNRFVRIVKVLNGN